MKITQEQITKILDKTEYARKKTTKTDQALFADKTNNKKRELWNYWCGKRSSLEIICEILKLEVKP